MIQELQQMRYDIHGLSRGKSGIIFLIASKRGEWDFKNKQCRTFIAINYKDMDYGWVTFKFSISRSALASTSVRSLTGDPEKFLLEAGLVRFRNILLNDDTPGKKEEFMIVSTSPESEYVMYEPDELHREVQFTRKELLKRLWEDRYRGNQATSRENIEEAMCTLFTISENVINSLSEQGLIEIHNDDNSLSITTEGEIEYEKISAPRMPLKDTNRETQSSHLQELDYDIFISHASEDKDDFVRELAQTLVDEGWKVWYDEFTLNIGDSLRRSIDRGLSSSRFGVVVLSHHFFSKSWPQRELDALFSKFSDTEGRILPVWHDISADDVKQYSPLLSDLLAVNSNEGIKAVVSKISVAIKQRS
ncbi:MAG: TIR domain-containing protein [Planctomycetia bacterium]|nr:TIR domain-containing protein [Planctomycetia bacterium]